LPFCRLLRICGLKFLLEVDSEMARKRSEFQHKSDFNPFNHENMETDEEVCGIKNEKLDQAAIKEEKSILINDRFDICRICGLNSTAARMLSLFEENRAELVEEVTGIDVIFAFAGYFHLKFIKFFPRSSALSKSNSKRLFASIASKT
jgi:hypothetical protein